MLTDSLVVSDLDGTLLNNAHTLDPLTIQTFQELQQRGVPLAIASGRHVVDIRVVRSLLGVSTYIISSNGAHLYDPDDNLLFEELLSPELVKALTSVERPDSVRLNLYTADAWYIDRADQAIRDFHASTGFEYEVDPSIVNSAHKGVGKVLYIGEPELLANIEADLRESLGDSVYITYALPNSLEVMAAGVNKAHAIRDLLGRIRLSAENCIAFGDNLNDIQMLEYVGHGNIMANANPLLFEVLPGVNVIGSNDEAGVAHELRKHFGLKD